MIGHGTAHAHGPERHVRARQPLRHRDDVWHDFPVIDGKPLAGAAESSHHLVADHQDSMLRAKLANALHVAIRRNQDAVGPGHRLENECRNRVRAFQLDDLFNHRQRRWRRFPPPLDPVVRIEHVDHAGQPGFHGPSPRIAGERHAACRRAVIRAIPREYLVAPRIEPRQLDRVLIRFGAAVCEEEHVDVARRDGSELRAQSCARFGRHERVRVREHRGLLLNRPDDALVAVADVDAHQLAVEIDVALVFRRPEVDALRARDGNRIHRGLRRPLEECVPATEFDDFFARHGFSCYSHRS